VSDRRDENSPHSLQFPGNSSSNKQQELGVCVCACARYPTNRLAVQLH